MIPTFSDRAITGFFKDFNCAKCMKALKALELADQVFQVVGSRAWGNNSKESDLDIFVTHSTAHADALHTTLKFAGFEKVQLYNGAPTDNHTIQMWRLVCDCGAKTDVQVVTKAKAIMYSLALAGFLPHLVNCIDKEVKRILVNHICDKITQVPSHPDILYLKRVRSAKGVHTLYIKHDRPMSRSSLDLEFDDKFQALATEYDLIEFEGAVKALPVCDAYNALYPDRDGIAFI